MKEKLKDKFQDMKTALCIIGGVTVALGAAFAVFKLCPKDKKKGKKGKKK